MFGRGVFLKGKSFHSIVIVVPLHVSKFYRVLKKLTAHSGPASKRGYQILCAFSILDFAVCQDV
jgi:hypothetical protein